MLNFKDRKEKEIQSNETNNRNNGKHYNQKEYFGYIKSYNTIMKIILSRKS